MRRNDGAPGIDKTTTRKELRVGFDNAADYLNTLLRAVTDNTKVVLTSRTQHFRSGAQIRTTLGDQVAALSASRVAVLQDFTNEQILQFLTRHYGGDLRAAQARFDLLGDTLPGSRRDSPPQESSGSWLS